MATNDLHFSLDVIPDYATWKLRQRFRKGTIEEFANQITIQHNRALRLGRQSTLTLELWAEILEKHHWACAYCNADDVPIDIEHAEPLSRGGHNTPENVVPACQTCNSSKGKLSVSEWRNRQQSQLGPEPDGFTGGSTVVYCSAPQIVNK